MLNPHKIGDWLVQILCGIPCIRLLDSSTEFCKWDHTYRNSWLFPYSRQFPINCNEDICLCPVMAADIQLHWFQFNFLNEPSQRLKLSRPGEFENRKLDGYIGEANSSAAGAGNLSQRHHPSSTKKWGHIGHPLPAQSCNASLLIAYPLLVHRNKQRQAKQMQSIHDRDSNLGSQPQSLREHPMSW